MSQYKFRRMFAVLFCVTALHLLASDLRGADYDPTASDYTGHTGSTIYVSKLGNNSDGSSWDNAYTTIQAGLLGVPNGSGGNRIIIRPDTYKEANLWTDFKGAAGSYNAVIGDVNGIHGSGATGRVIIDSGAPEGFKSYNWWTTIKASKFYVGGTEEFSAICWDRWILRDLYATGADAGLFFDLTQESGSQFTVIVDKCVSIGRAFGGGFGYSVTRPGEPSVFSNSYLMALDMYSDAGAIGIGAYNTSKPGEPDVIFKNCVAVSPDNAVQVLYPNKHLSAKFQDCKLITLNFAQTTGGIPSTGIIRIDNAASHLYLDLEDTTLVGYKVFGAGNGASISGNISYTTEGDVAAYVQYLQSVPAGITRLADFPVEVFDAIGPPQPAPGPIPGDANLDNVVDDADASILAAHWQQTGMGWGDGDFDGNGIVNDADASILAANWQESQEGAAVPEPSTVVLLAFGLAGLVALRRR